MRPGRLAAGGPPRGPRTSHGRERARSGGETLAAAGPAGAQHGTASLGAHPEAEAVGLGALAIVGLVRALQRKSPLEEVARGPKSGDRAGGGNDPVYGAARRAQRGSAHDVASLGKTPAAPCRTRTPVLRCAPRSAAGRCPSSFRCVTARPRPNRCNTSGAISTPVDSPVDKSAVDGKTTRSGRERTVGVDGGRDLGSGFSDAAGAARARHLGGVVPRRPPPRLRR